MPSASYIFMITPWLHKSFCPMYNPCESQIELSDTSLVFARASRSMFCLLQWMLSINTQATFRRLEDQTCLNVMAWEMTGWVWKRESWREEKLYWKASGQSGCEAVTNDHVSCTSLSSLGTVKYYPFWYLIREEWLVNFLFLDFRSNVSSNTIKILIIHVINTICFVKSPFLYHLHKTLFDRFREGHYVNNSVISNNYYS